MNQRTKALWLPALASLAAASLFTLALTEISLQPHIIARLNSTVAPLLYVVWLFSNLFFGALGAFLSRRAGGSRLARIVAGTFPAIVMFLLCGLVIPVSALFFEHNTVVRNHPSRLALGILIWAAAPAVALMLGAASFLRDSSLRQA